MIRSILSHGLALYLGAGLFGGLLMQQAIPAMNGLGVAFYAVTWPRHVYCAPVARGCEPMEQWLPDWAQRQMYTFSATPETQTRKQ